MPCRWARRCWFAFTGPICSSNLVANRRKLGPNISSWSSFSPAERSRNRRPTRRCQFGTLEPLAPGWAGNVLLARAAAYAKHRDYYSTLFDKDSLEPRIATEPFVRALTELVATRQTRSKSAD